MVVGTVSRGGCFLDGCSGEGSEERWNVVTGGRPRESCFMDGCLGEGVEER